MGRTLGEALPISQVFHILGPMWFKKAEPTSIERLEALSGAIRDLREELTDLRAEHRSLSTDVTGIEMSLRKLRGRLTGGKRGDNGEAPPVETEALDINEMIRRGLDPRSLRR